MSSRCPLQHWVVVVLTHNEAPSIIQACLRSVREATDAFLSQSPTATVRIRIVDDSHPSLRATWVDLATSLGMEVMYISGGIASKRNTAVKGVNADAIAFTDADCEVHQEWLITHAAAYAAHPEAPGVVGMTLHQAVGIPVYAAMQHAGFLVGFQFPRLMQETLWGPCSNLSLRIDVFEEVGGFDEVFSYASEDVDIGLRICMYTGRRLICVTSAPVRHAVAPFVRNVYGRVWKWGAGEAILLSRHPSYRVFAPPRVAIYVLVALSWALIDALAYSHLTSLIWFVLIYVICGPIFEARETKSYWAVVIRSRILRVLFQLRTCIDLLGAGHLDLLKTQMNYGEGQFAFEWPAVTRYMWEFLTFVFLAGLTPR